MVPLNLGDADRTAYRDQTTAEIRHDRPSRDWNELAPAAGVFIHNDAPPALVGCFDRTVIHGYLTALSRPLVVHFFRDIVGVAEVSKEALSQRTNDYQRWLEAYARNH